MYPRLATFISVGSAERDLLAGGVFIEVAMRSLAALRTVRVCARVRMCVRSSYLQYSLLWKKLGTLGSNDSGSPQHLATVLCACVCVCVRVSVCPCTEETAHLNVLELGWDQCVGGILLIYQK